MKKLIAISVMLALIAGAVFAETTISGNVETRLVLAEGDNSKKIGSDDPANVPKTYGALGGAKIALSGTNDEGTVGGKLVMKFEQINDNGRVGHESAFVWWKPIPQIRIFLGMDGDGQFDTMQLTGWQYIKGSENYINYHDWDYWRMIFPGNWDGFGLALSLYPVEGLDINIVVPTGKLDWPQSKPSNYDARKRVDEVYIDSLEIQANYAIQDVGKIQFTWQGKNYVASKGSGGVAKLDFNNNNDKKAENQQSNGQVGASFLLTAVEGIEVLAGGSVLLANKDDKGLGSEAKDVTYLGLAATYAADAFGVKARIGYTMNQKFDKDKSGLVLSLLPYYKLDSTTLFFEFGFTQTTDKNADPETQNFITINPFAVVDLGPGYFKAGLKVKSYSEKQGNTSSYDKTNEWSIPILLGFNF